MKGVILDIDGVLRRGGEPIPGAVKSLDRIGEMGLRICYLTNNSTATRSSQLASLVSLGFPDAPLVNSAYAASIYILDEHGASRCLVVGEAGLHEELRAAGHDTIPAATIGRPGRDLDPTDDIFETSCDLVVAGLDRDLTYSRIAHAQKALRSGALFIATNEDPTLPCEGGYVIPGAGTIVSALERCSGIKPIVVGKPQPFSTVLALREMGLEPPDVLMIGDRPDTDIEAGKAAGTLVAMVTTGDVKEVEDPDFPVFSDLCTLIDSML